MIVGWDGVTTTLLQVEAALFSDTSVNRLPTLVVLVVALQSSAVALPTESVLQLIRDCVKLECRLSCISMSVMSTAIIERATYCSTHANEPHAHHWAHQQEFECAEPQSQQLLLPVHVGLLEHHDLYHQQWAPIRHHGAPGPSRPSCEPRRDPSCEWFGLRRLSDHSMCGAGEYAHETKGGCSVILNVDRPFQEVVRVKTSSSSSLVQAWILPLRKERPDTNGAVVTRRSHLTKLEIVQ